MHDTIKKRSLIKRTKDAIREQFEGAKREIEEVGGWQGFKSGEWFLHLVNKFFHAYYQNAHHGYFRAKYPGANDDTLIEKLTSVAAKNAAILGGIVGATVSADEIVALVTAGEGGIGLPANITIALTAIAGEMILLTRIQLQLVANIAKILQVPLDRDDPEDILLIFAFAVGGGASEAAGKAGMKIGGRLTRFAIKKTIKKEVLKKLKAIAQKLGYKLLQKTIIKYAVPLASIGVGATWNYVSTRAIAKIAKKHLVERKKQQDSGTTQEGLGVEPS